MNLQPHFFSEKAQQLKGKTRDEQLGQLFEWVKTGHISKRIFQELIMLVDLAKEPKQPVYWEIQELSGRTFVLSAAEFTKRSFDTGAFTPLFKD